MGISWIVLKLVNYDLLLLIVDEILINCCCCCYEMCCWWLDAMGFHKYGIVMEIELLIEGFVKLCEFVGLCWNDVLNPSSIRFWVSFEYISLGTNLGVGRSKIGFWDEKWCKPLKKLCRIDDSSLKRAASEMSPVATGRILLKRDLLPSSEMLSDSMPCFAFSHLFHTILFWIGFWCKYESFIWLN